MKDLLKTIAAAADSDLDPRYARALSLRAQNKLHEALDVLNEVYREGHRSFRLLVLLGECSWEVDETAEAIAHFRAAIDVDPESEAVSLGLFHCLWEMGRSDDAFSEMKRFTAICASAEYARLVKDLLRE